MTRRETAIGIAAALVFGAVLVVLELREPNPCGPWCHTIEQIRQDWNRHKTMPQPPCLR